MLLQTKRNIWAQLAFCNQAALGGPLMHRAQLRSVSSGFHWWLGTGAEVIALLLCDWTLQYCVFPFKFFPLQQVCVWSASGCLYTLMKLFVTVVTSSDGQQKLSARTLFTCPLYFTWKFSEKGNEQLRVCILSLFLKKNLIQCWGG